MKLQLRDFSRTVVGFLMFALFGLASAQAQVQIVTDIDRISTSQSITANEFNPTPVSVIRTAGAIGGWRTLALTGVGNFSIGDEAFLSASGLA